MKRLVVAAALVALASAPIPAQRSVELAGSSAVPAAPRTVLAAVPSWRQRTELLVRLDARTLTRLPGPGLPIRLAPFATAWSPDHRLLAVVGQHGPVGPDGADWPTAPELRVVDPAHRGVLSTTRLVPFGGHAQWLAWLGPDHVLVLGWRRLTGPRAWIVDVRTGRITRTVALPALWEIAAARGGRAVVMPERSESAPGAATLLVFDSSGVRQVALPDVPLGEVGSGEQARVQHPGLAVTADGRRAYAMAPGGPVEEVDLDTLAVGAHPLQTGSASLLTRIARALQPSAQAKELNGDARCLAVTPSGQLLVTGWSSDGTFNDGDGTYSVTRVPAGLTLVDPTSWSATLLSADVSIVQTAGPIVLGLGERVDANTTVGLGLHGFRADAPPFTALAGRDVGLLIQVGRYGYVPLLDPARRAVVDLATGAVIARSKLPDQAWIIPDAGPYACP